MTGLGRSGGRFSAILSPNGILLVEYHQLGDVLGVVEFAADRPERKDLATATEQLARLTESLGGRGGELSLAISGFGVSHHILTLPPASPELLEPVVAREMKRFYPDLRDPVIGFVVAGMTDTREGPNQDVLVGAVPRNTVEGLHRTLANRGIRLEHVTIVPRIVQHIHDAVEASVEPSVLVLMLESGPVIGCFQDGDLRLCSEPLRGALGVPATDVEAVVEHVERGVLFLNQQFPGQATADVRVVSLEEVYDEVAEGIQDEMDVRVERLDAGLSPNALAALGPAMDARSTHPLNLLPEPLRPEPTAARWARGLAAAAALLVAVAALWWSVSATRAARSVEARVDALQAQLERRVPALARMRPVLEERRSHEARLAFLAPAGERELRVQRILRAVALSTAPGVRLDSLLLQHSGSNWSVSVAGVATGASNAAAVRAVDVLYRGVGDHVPVDSVHLGRLGALAADSTGAVAVSFEMSFIVRREADLGR